ncbi:hypothetical protein SLS62_001563 [Diatrype stigma]|uniref:Fumarylacetoacetase n=1 Tax=Diatrype stigma TaxID=117547 RepID=A0AAN9V0K2_9PEZI
MASTWVPDVSPDSPFSLANIPFGIISTVDNVAPHAATAIGSHVLDLKVLCSDPRVAQLLSSSPRPPRPVGKEIDEFPAPAPAPAPDYAAIFSQPTLNAFAALGRPAHRFVRAALQDLLSAETRHPEVLRDNEELRRRALVRDSAEVTMHLPMAIGDYTDFYAGYHHAHAVGSMFRGPQHALQPNYTHLPVGYHGRASSIVVSGTGVRRPRGQILLDGEPTAAPSRRLDFELELGCLIATPNALGEPVAVADAEDRVFGYVLLNDWSARDVQTWEYVPLGPFNSKNFASTVSPWVVLADALEPFRAGAIENATLLQDYLKEGRKDSVFDIELEVDLETPSGDVTTISTTSSKFLLWSFPQMIAHHTLGGCPMRTGDLLGSGTISGPGPNQSGSLLEMSDGGKKDVLLYGMDVRRFLRDGDTVTMRGSCGKSGERVGFGSCVGRILPPK